MKYVVCCKAAAFRQLLECQNTIEGRDTVHNGSVLPAQTFEQGSTVSKLSCLRENDVCR